MISSHAFNFFEKKIMSVVSCLQKEQEDEGILLKPLQFYDNKPTVEELMSKPDGLLYVIDEASRSNSGHSFIIG